MADIVYEDRHLVVCVKPVGCLSEDGPSETCMPARLREHFRLAGKPDHIAGVHRLDKVVGGLMVFSRRKEVTGKLIASVSAHEVTKEYLASFPHLEGKYGVYITESAGGIRL